MIGSLEFVQNVGRNLIEAHLRGCGTLYFATLFPIQRRFRALHRLLRDSFPEEGTPQGWIGQRFAE
jgi:hypothetical protein